MAFLCCSLTPPQFYKLQIPEKVPGGALIKIHSPKGLINLSMPGIILLITGVHSLSR